LIKLRKQWKRIINSLKKVYIRDGICQRSGGWMNISIERIAIPVGIALLSAAALLVIRHFSLRFLHRWAEKTEAKIDDIILGSLKTPSFYWCLAIGLYIGVEISDLPKRYVLYFSKMVHIFIILSITIAAANLGEKRLEEINTLFQNGQYFTET
jgi:uncharacterized protein YacL